MSFLNTVFLSSNYPSSGNLNYDQKIRVSGDSPFNFNLQNIEYDVGNGLGIYKIFFEYGDLTNEYLNIEYDISSSKFEPPSAVSHLYTSNLSTLNTNFSGNAIFYYRNGYNITFNFNIFYTEKNIIEQKPILVNSSMFVTGLSANSLFGLINDNDVFFNKIVTSKEFEVFVPEENILSFNSLNAENGNFLILENGSYIELDI